MMPAFYIDDDRKFIWARIAKNANTSIKEAISYKKTYTNLDNIGVFPHEKYNDYFKFVIVRNPWDRHVSLYSWFHQWKKKGARHLCDIPKNLTFETFVKKRKKDYTDRLMVHSYPQHLYFRWTEFDFIGRYESLRKDWKFLMDKFGFPSLEVTNKSDRRKYRSYYNEETKQIIADEYRNDIKLLNYSF